MGRGDTMLLKSPKLCANRRREWNLMRYLIAGPNRFCDQLLSVFRQPVPFAPRYVCQCRFADLAPDVARCVSALSSSFAMAVLQF